jgi:hypothetical protein
MSKKAVPLAYNRKLAFRISSLLLLLLLNVWIVAGRMTLHKPIQLEFPLKNGTYYILQGGNGGINNFFHSFIPEDKYALDIVKLNSFGNRANGFYPKNLNKYNIFSEPVYSPCNGHVIEVMDTLPDNTPGNVDKMNTYGNYIVIKTAGYRIYLCHLQKNSIQVKTGEIITPHQQIAKVGNSGYTNEPHLHIHVTKTSIKTEVVPISYRGRFLSLNNIYRN